MQQEFQKISSRGLTKAPLFWNCKEIGMFICEILGLPQLKGIIEEMKLNGNDFLQLDESEYKEDFEISDQKTIEKLQHGFKILKEYEQYLINSKMSTNELSQICDDSNNNYNQNQQSNEIQLECNDLAMSIPIHVVNVRPISNNKQNDRMQEEHKKQEFQQIQELEQEQMSIIVYKIQLPYNAFDFSKDSDSDELEDISSLIGNQDPKAKMQQFIQKFQKPTGPPKLTLQSIKVGNQQQIFSSINYTVDKSGATIGKLNTNKIQLKQDSISRNHCQIIYKSETNNFYIQDVKSKSGTFLRIKQKAQIVTEKSIFEIGFNEIQINHIKVQGKEAEISVEVIEGNDDLKNQVKVLKLRENVAFIIGGHSDSQFWIKADQDIDKYHAKLNLYQGQITIEDLDTKCGTWLRLSLPTVKSEPHLLNQFDEIKLNPFGFRVELENTSAQSNQMSLQGLCMKCKSSKSSIVFLPCNHKVACNQCAQQFQNCPLCRVQIQSKNRIFQV